MKKRVVSTVIFGIVYAIVAALLFFYLDLANGPTFLLIVEVIALGIALTYRIIIHQQRFIVRLVTFAILALLNVPIFFLAHPTTERFKPVDEIVETEVMHLENGDVVGTYNNDKSVRIYSGIPYAEAPIGNLRFREPQDKENWEGILNCTYFAPRAMQKDQSQLMSSAVNIYSMKRWVPDYKMYPIQDMSEDCLYLNIWRPNTDETNLPILVYIHGGSLMTGSSAASDTNGETYAKKGVIMITVSYRLGVFGYFAHNDLINESPNNTTGNYGLLDQIKALKWVNDNASYFGGNKDNITIAGESAGSSSISALCTSPLAKGLFKKAVGESSSLVVSKTPHTFRKLDDAIKMGNDIMKEFKCNSIEDLRKIDAKELVKTKYTNSMMTVDGYALTKTPYEVYLEGNNNEEYLLNGYNVKEADGFVIPNFLLSPTNKKNIRERLISYFDETAANQIMELYKGRIEEDAFTAFNEIISVYWFINPHHSWSKMALNNNVKVYRYQFTKENGYYGTYHSGEIIYLYGNIERSNHRSCYDDNDIKLQDMMVSYMINYIKTDNPNGEGLPQWDLYTYGGNVMELGTNVGSITDKYLDLYPIIEAFNERNK